MNHSDTLERYTCIPSDADYLEIEANFNYLDGDCIHTVTMLAADGIEFSVKGGKLRIQNELTSPKNKLNLLVEEVIEMATKDTDLHPFISSYIAQDCLEYLLADSVEVVEKEHALNAKFNVPISAILSHFVYTYCDPGDSIKLSTGSYFLQINQ